MRFISTEMRDFVFEIDMMNALNFKFSIYFLANLPHDDGHKYS